MLEVMSLEVEGSQTQWIVASYKSACTQSIMNTLQHSATYFRVLESDRIQVNSSE